MPTSFQFLSAYKVLRFTLGLVFVFGLFIFLGKHYSIGRAKINGFQTLKEKLMICGPKNSPPKFQPPLKGIQPKVFPKGLKSLDFDPPYSWHILATCPAHLKRWIFLDATILGPWIVCIVVVAYPYLWAQYLWYRRKSSQTIILCNFKSFWYNTWKL